MDEVPILLGLETEYGISRQNPNADHDVVAESIALVRAAREPAVRMRWDYSCEDPHVDARGFRVKELRQDFDEAHYFAQDAARPLSFSEIKSDLALMNGARFYNDHAHPEYCTPECRTTEELLRQDALGDDLVTRCAESVSAQTASSPEGRVLIYKNNTDFRGHSYGCHENYLVSRRLEWARLSRAMLAFLVTRQIFAGSGKYGWEREDAYDASGFQISQRGDFFSVLESVDTMQRRPIVNTRDEPHADARSYRRFHVICGDANLSPFSTYLKVGTTAAVLQALSHGVPEEKVPRLEDPVAAIKHVSRDTSWKWHCTAHDGKATTAVEVQRDYLELVRAYGGDVSNLLNLEDWEEVLNDLETDPTRTADRLDWMAKRHLIESFRESEKVKPGDPWLISLDLAYHLLDPEEGLFYGLQEAGALRNPYPPQPRSAFTAPEGTRAQIRGWCVHRFGDRIEAAQWDHVRLRQGDLRIELDLRSLINPDEVRRTMAVLKEAREVADLASLPFAKPYNPI